MNMPARDRLGLDLKRAEQALMSAKTVALQTVDLTVAQYAALQALGDCPGMSAAELARRCLVTPQAMTSVLGGLVERGLVTRTVHPRHQHVRELHLTTAGQDLAARADALAVAIEQRIARAFSDDERERMREMLARVITAIGE